MTNERIAVCAFCSLLRIKVISMLIIMAKE
jgi:hypothetical protein